MAILGIVAIADGKIYAEMGENIYRDFMTGEYAYSEYNCYNAYTGELIWTLPLENDAPMNYQCIAYGNLYLIPTVSSTETGEWAYSYDLGSEVWCISSDVTDWSMFLGDTEHSSEGAGPTNLALKWKFSADAAILSAPTLADGTCYFGCLDSNIYAIDAETGTKLWTFETDYQIKSQPAFVDGRLYTGADDGNVYCLDASTGNVLWTADEPEDDLKHGSLIRSSPMVSGNKVYVGSLDGNMYCFSTSTGNLLWNFQTGGSVLATAAVVGNELYITTGISYVSGILYKLDANTGTRIWNCSFPYFQYYSSSIPVSPTVADGMVFVRSDYRYNYAVNATTGEIIWMYDCKYNPGTPQQANGVALYDAILYKYGRVYLNDYYGLSCLNATDGTLLWHSYLGRETMATGMSYAYSRIYFVTETRVLYVIDALTGAKISYYEGFGSMIRAAPTPYNGDLYVSCVDFNVYCFGEARLMSSEPAVSASVSSQQIMSEAVEVTEPAEAPVITTEVALIVTVAIACVIGLVSFWALRKRK